MSIKRSATKVKEREAKTKAEERRELIDCMYVHCRLCGFFFLRRFPGDEVCDSPQHRVDDTDINLIL
jgi:hypothetical protein